MVLYRPLNQQSFTQVPVPVTGTMLVSQRTGHDPRGT